ncbi:XRE family transcriptional regulator [Mesorhizobium loti]|jgi:predicted transcriptional regulator|nr:XRE family transcriptional regulator [Mesorhizobium loti]
MDNQAGPADDHCRADACRKALAGIDQKTLAERAGVSLPTIQRMEASDGHW